MIWDVQSSLQTVPFKTEFGNFIKFAINYTPHKNLLRLKNQKEIIEVELSPTIRIKKKIPIPFKLYSTTLLGNGDLIVSILIKKATESHKKFEYFSRRFYFDLDKKIDTNLNEFEVVDQIEYDFNPDFPGQHFLLAEQNHVPCYFLVSNKKMDAPYVVMGDKIIEHQDFYEQISEDIVWKNKLYVGLASGDCYIFEFHETRQGELIKSKKQIFKNGKPVDVDLVSNTKSQKIENISYKENLSTITENFSTIVKKEENTVNTLPCISDCKLLLKEKLEIVLVSETFELKEEHTVKCGLFIRKTDSLAWASSTINTDYKTKSIFNRLVMNFQCNIIKPTLSESKLNLYITSSLGIVLADFCKNSNEIQLKRFLQIDNKNSNLIKYSPSMDTFFFPVNNTVQFINKSLTHCIHTLTFDSEIYSLMLDEEAKKLIVYDKSDYFEIDLSNITVCRQLNFQKSSKQVKFPLNLQFISNENLEFSDLSTNQILLVNSEPILNSINFPFTFLKNCFSKERYSNAVKGFSEYYYNQIKLNNFEDNFFGPINPLTFALLFDDMALLKKLLTEYGYPRKIKDYLSPFAFAMKQDNNFAIKIFYDYFIENQDVVFSRTDFQYLLRSPYTYLHKLIARIPSAPKIRHFPKMIEMKDDVSVSFFQKKIDLLEKVQKMALKVRVIDSNETISTKTTKQQTENKTEITAYHIPFKYSFRIGTPDSVDFLDLFSETQEEELLLSEWKEIIYSKWRSHKIFHYIFAFCFWTFTILVCLNIIFFKDIQNLEIAVYVFIGIFLLYEFIQVISYSTISIKR